MIGTQHRWYKLTRPIFVDPGVPKMPADELALWRLRQQRDARTAVRFMMGQIAAMVYLFPAIFVAAQLAGWFVMPAGTPLSLQGGEIGTPVEHALGLLLFAATVLVVLKIGDEQAWVSRPRTDPGKLALARRAAVAIGVFVLVLIVASLLLGGAMVRAGIGLLSAYFIAAAGFGFAVAGVRCRMGEAVVCASCTYERDVAAIGTAAPCPECGRPCRTIRDLRMGRRGMHPRLLWSAAACLAAAGLLMLLAVVSALSV